VVYSRFRTWTLYLLALSVTLGGVSVPTAKAQSADGVETQFLKLVKTESERARPRFKMANRPGSTRPAKRGWLRCLADDVPGTRFFRSIGSTRRQTAAFLRGPRPTVEVLPFPTHL